MSDVYWLYIIDGAGTTIFSYENQLQESSQTNTALLSHLIFALKSITKDINEDEIRGIEMGNDKFFISREKFGNYLFILKTNRNTDSELINPILIDIKNKFYEKFKGHFSLIVDEKTDLLDAFKADVKEIMKIRTNVEDFIGILSD